MPTIRHGYRVHVRRRHKGQIVRWVLRDSGDRYWTGTDWSLDRTRATLYANHGEAKCDAAMFEYDASPRRFFTFLNITVDPPGDFTEVELCNYLKRNLRIYVVDDGGSSSLDKARFKFGFDGNLLQEE